MYTGLSVSELVRIKICLDSESLKEGSQYLNSDKSYKSLDAEAPRYLHRGGGGLGIRKIWIQRLQCLLSFLSFVYPKRHRDYKPVVYYNQDKYLLQFIKFS